MSGCTMKLDLFYSTGFDAVEMSFLYSIWLPWTIHLHVLVNI